MNSSYLNFPCFQHQSTLTYTHSLEESFFHFCIENGIRNELCIENGKVGLHICVYHSWFCNSDLKSPIISGKKWTDLEFWFQAMIILFRGIISFLRMDVMLNPILVMSTRFHIFLIWHYNQLILTHAKVVRFG